MEYVYTEEEMSAINDMIAGIEREAIELRINLQRAGQGDKEAEKQCFYILGQQHGTILKLKSAIADGCIETVK